MKEIKLTHEQVALVDDNDFEWLNQWHWTAIKYKHTYYACRHSRGKTIRMHRLILDINDPTILSDHIDHNGLNNQRYNLRLATRSQNLCNSNKKTNCASKYRGVIWDSTNQKWIAKIQKDGISNHLGRFKTEIEAALIYNNAAIELHKEFANPNKL